MIMTFNIADFENHMSSIGRTITSAKPIILKNAGIDMLVASRPVTPWEFGDLAASGTVSYLGDKVSVKYSSVKTKYGHSFDVAEIQDRRTDFKHLPGKKAHYLSDEYTKKAPKYIDQMARDIKRYL